MQPVAFVFFSTVVEQRHPWIFDSQHAFGIETAQMSILNQIALLGLSIGATIQVDKTVP